MEKYDKIAKLLLAGEMLLARYYAMSNGINLEEEWQDIIYYSMTPRLYAFPSQYEYSVGYEFLGFTAFFLYGYREPSFVFSESVSILLDNDIEDPTPRDVVLELVDRKGELAIHSLENLIDYVVKKHYKRIFREVTEASS